MVLSTGPESAEFDSSLIIGKSIFGFLFVFLRLFLKSFDPFISLIAQNI